MFDETAVYLTDPAGCAKRRLNQPRVSSEQIRAHGSFSSAPGEVFKAARKGTFLAWARKDSPADFSG